MTPAARSPATPGKTRQALILDGLFGRMVVSFGRVSGLPWGHGWHRWVVIWASVGPMKAVTRHALLAGTFWATGWPKKASKRHGAPKPFLHIFTKEVDEFHRFFGRFWVDRRGAAQDITNKTKTHIRPMHFDGV